MGTTPIFTILYVRLFPNMAMPRYSNNSNTCISQNTPESHNVAFGDKTRTFFFISGGGGGEGGGLGIPDSIIICNLNNAASNLKQDK